MLHVTLLSCITALFLSVPAAAIPAFPHGGERLARPSIRPVLTPLLERDVPHLIGLNCPTDHVNRVMETLWETRAGQRQSIRVTYRAGRMQTLEILGALGNEGFRSSLFMDLTLGRDAEYHESVLSMASAADRLRQDVCLADTVACARHQAQMAANRAMLLQPS